MLDKFQWLLKSEEVNFEKKRFRGKLAGKAYKYSRHIDGLIRTRIIIFAMSVLVLYPVLANYLFHDLFDLYFLIERIVFAVLLLIAGLLFNKVRVLSIIIAVIPLIIITTTYILIPGQFNFRVVAFMIAIILIILVGIYHNFQSKRIKRDLENTYVENHLIE